MKTVMLSVGISQYASPEIDDLTVCHLDAERMAETWRGVAGDGFQVKLLRNEEATREGIKAGVAWLAKTAQPGDLALFYYSGHGASFEDDQSDEGDGRDEFLCPADCGLETGVHTFIRDDELRQWLAAVNQKTNTVVLIFDSCHSGSANMAPEGAAIPKELPEHITRKLLGDYKPPRSKSASAASASAGAADATHVPGQILLAGCQDYQQSFILNGWENSLFTGCLIKALEDNSLTSLQDLFAQARQQVQDEADMSGIQQTPNLIDGLEQPLTFR